MTFRSSEIHNFPSRLCSNWVIHFHRSSIVVQPNATTFPSVSKLEIFLFDGTRRFDDERLENRCFGEIRDIGSKSASLRKLENEFEDKSNYEKISEHWIRTFFN